MKDVRQNIIVGNSRLCIVDNKGEYSSIKIQLLNYLGGRLNAF